MGMPYWSEKHSPPTKNWGPRPILAHAYLSRWHPHSHYCGIIWVIMKPCVESVERCFKTLYCSALQGIFFWYVDLPGAGPTVLHACWEQVKKLKEHYTTEYNFLFIVWVILIFNAAHKDTEFVSTLMSWAHDEAISLIRYLEVKVKIGILHSQKHHSWVCIIYILHV